MDFDEAYECLNNFDIAPVAAEMAEWHPAILGQMLLAVEAAKKVRYPLYHPDYYDPLKTCLAAEPPGPGSVKPARQSAFVSALMGAVERLEKRWWLSRWT